MAKDIEEHIIDGVEYTFTKYPLKKSMRMLTKVTKVLGQPVVEILGAKEGIESLMDKEIDTEAVGKSLAAMATQFEGDDLYDLIKDICTCVIAKETEISGDKVVGGQLDKNFDLHFAKRMTAMFMVTAQALKHNYQDFFVELLAKSGVVKAGIKDTTQVSTT